MIDVDPTSWPLTTHQRRAWVGGLLQKAGPAFAVAWRCPAERTPEDLAGHWRRFSEREPLAFLRLRAERQVPSLVLSDAPPPPALIDHPEGDTLAGRLATARARSWDLSDQPGLRATILPAQDGSVLLVEAHPAVCDETAFRFLVQAFLSDADGAPAATVEARRMLRERPVLSDQEYARSRDDWCMRMRGAPATSEVPHDHPRCAGYVTHLRITLRVGRPAAGMLRRERDDGVPSLLLAATAAVCLRLTGQDDLVLGCLWSGDVPAPRALSGSVWPARLDLRDDPSGGTLHDTARAEVAHIARNRALPLGDIIEAAGVGGTPEHAPLFQVLVGRDPSFNGLYGEPVLSDPLAATCDLAFLVGNDDHLVLLYRPDLFTAETARRLLSQVACACDAIAEEPTVRLSAIRLQSAADEQAQRAACASLQEFPVTGCLHDLFTEQARLRPSAQALVAQGRTVTYGELEKQANRLAHRLSELGVGPDVLVGHCLPRTVEAVVAILAILKAGGAYVPLYPAHPAERSAATLLDAGANVVISDSTLSGRFDGIRATQVLLDRHAAEIATRPDTPLPVAVAPQHLAYVIYTSGSTGRPKGVPITHAQVVRLFAATQAWFSFGAGDVWTLFHSLAFDFSVWELWGPLLHGGRLVLVDELVQRSPGDFHALVRREGVTVLNQTPAAFYQFARADEVSGRPTSVRLVIFGGEKLELSALAGWFARHGDQQPRLVNMYGITETTVHVTYRRLSQSDLARPRISPIGVPIPDLALHLLDSALRPVPVGVIGEIHVGGAGVGRGYLNREDLTAARFIPDPFRPGHLLYRSGDAARRLADGEIDYVGRLDQQVKIRGYRIELGEIEAMLRGQAAVADCAVTVHQTTEQAADRTLVAYVVLREHAQPHEPVIAELRRAARSGLPGHMVPSSFVVLERLPLTVNGKLDRRALPAPAVPQGAHATHVPATTGLERSIVSAWSRVLGGASIGIDDNFFDVGGNSLRLVQAHALLEQELGRGIPLVDLFRFTTVRSLATHLADADPPGCRSTQQATCERAERQRQALAARRPIRRTTGP
jgi:amino acid adenylation domain-containing protein